MRFFVALATALAAAVLPASAYALTRADRAAINRTLDRFITTAVARKNVGASYTLATAHLRQGMTRAEWAKGDIPVYPFPVRGTRFHDWTLDTASANSVELDVLVQSPRRSRQGAVALTIDLKRMRGRWLVDQIVPTATFAPPSKEPRVRGPNDYAAPSAGASNDAGDSRLGSTWALIPILLVAGIVLVPAGFFLYGWQRDRRLARAYSRR
jgi:hypothetical protein